MSEIPIIDFSEMDLAVSRKMHQAFTTVGFAVFTNVYNQWQSCIPSRFVEELPSDELETSSETGVAGGLPSLGGYGESYPGGIDWDGKERGPGFKRWQRARPRTSIIEGKTQRVSESASDNSITEGTRVFHQKFGYGTVSNIDGNHLDISFEKSSPKKVMSDFVEKLEEFLITLFFSQVSPFTLPNFHNNANSILSNFFG